MKNKKYLLLLILLFAINHLKAQECNCTSEDYKKWDDGGITFTSGEINRLESSKTIIKDKIKINNGNMLAIKSDVNKYHNGYYFRFNTYYRNTIKIPENFTIRLTNNKGVYISVKGSTGIGESSNYYIFISQENMKFKNFINSGLITKIEFIDSIKNDLVFTKYYLSLDESLEITKLFCCAIKLKKEIIGQES